jgi:hypothetical protein
MTQEDIVRMARETGDVETDRRGRETFSYDSYGLERFAALVAAAEREKVAAWMRSMGYATGHGDTIEDLLDHLGTQIAEGLKIEMLTEREACAKVCEDTTAAWTQPVWIAPPPSAQGVTNDPRRHHPHGAGGGLP